LEICSSRGAAKISFLAELEALRPQQLQDIPRVMEVAKKFGLEILPPKREVLS
jgi:hypothetical protein